MSKVQTTAEKQMFAADTNTVLLSIDRLCSANWSVCAPVSWNTHGDQNFSTEVSWLDLPKPITCDFNALLYRVYKYMKLPWFELCNRNAGQPWEGRKSAEPKSRESSRVTFLAVFLLVLYTELTSCVNNWAWKPSTRVCSKVCAIMLISTIHCTLSLSMKADFWLCFGV